VYEALRYIPRATKRKEKKKRKGGERRREERRERSLEVKAAMVAPLTTETQIPSLFLFYHC
jgi:hypothetical protein